MTQGIGAGGFIGIAFETVTNTYTAPVKYFPIENESLKFVQETNWRRPIRQSADIIGAVDGDVRVEGDIMMEAFEDVVPYFLHCARATVVKAGSGNYTYTYTPSASAIAPNHTMSITVIRNGVVYGYVGCVVGQFTFSIDNETLKFNASILGSDEASQSLPTPTFITTAPFGAGKYNIQVPTGSQIFDTDTFEFQVNDNAESQYRLKDTGRGAQFVKFGEREVTATLERDFDTRTDYDAFKALTAQSITFTATKGANNSISLNLPAAIKDDYTVNLSGQGDLLRATVPYKGVIDGTGKSYSIVVKAQENLT